MFCGRHLGRYQGAMRSGKFAARSTDPTWRERDLVLLNDLTFRDYEAILAGRLGIPWRGRYEARSGPCLIRGRPATGPALAETHRRPACDECLDAVEACVAECGPRAAVAFQNLLAARAALAIRAVPRGYGEMSVRDAGRLRGLESRGGRHAIGSAEDEFIEDARDEWFARHTALTEGLGGED
jgi:hypothetical protein